MSWPPRNEAFVQTGERSLRHMPFIEALATVSDTGPEWRRVSAGFFCLRFVDDWAADASQEAIAYAMSSVEASVEALSAQDPVRRALDGLLRSLRASPRGTTATLRPRLLAYGRLLEADALWRLATDVYETVLGLISSPCDGSEAASVGTRLGDCLRKQALWDDAMRAYADAASHARLVNDVGSSLRARVYRASVVAERGNLPAAEGLLEAIEREAISARLPEFRGLALYGRAHVAFQRRDFESAVRLGYEASTYVSDSPERDNILADLATSFAELGMRDAARSALLIVAATGRQPYVRYTAVINLMEYAALDGAETIFENYRKELAAAPLPPRLAGYFRLYAANGALQFGRTELAREEYNRALVIATSHELAQLIFETEAALAKLDAVTPTRALAPVFEPSLATLDVVNALRRMSTAVARRV